MDFELLTNKGFSGASEAEQKKELFTLYGICVISLAKFDNFFINQLWVDRTIFEKEETGKELSEVEKQKFSTHYYSKATLGMQVKDFASAFKTDGVQQWFDELIRLRNLLAHRFDLLNPENTSDKAMREKTYTYLLEILTFTKELEDTITGKMFTSLKNPNYQARLKNRSKDE